MNITEIIGEPVADRGTFAPASGRACDHVASPEPEPAEPSRRAAAVIALIVVGTLAAGMAIGTMLPVSRSGGPVPATSGLAGSPAPSHVGDVAALALQLHLTGLSEPSQVLTAAPGSSDSPTGIWVNASAAIASKPLGNDQWQITLAADVMELVDGTYESAGIQYFQMAIGAGSGSPTALTPPARIPPPQLSIPDTTRFSGAVPADQATAVTAFLEAHLTGTGELQRYATPTARIRSFPEPPFAGISIESLGSDSLGQVQARLLATTQRGSQLLLAYTLDMTFDGVWEVAAIHSSPGATK